MEKFDTPSLPVRAIFALKAGASDPRLLFELIAKFSRRVLTTKKHARRLAEYSPFSVDDRAAIAAVTGASYSDVEAILAEPALRAVRSECLALANAKNIGEYTWGGFADMCYAICRLHEPTTVLETGVAFGWTSAFILAALDVNGHGRLHSIDLPAFRPDVDRITGAVVPDRLRSRWVLSLGPQSQMLRSALAELDTVDFFHYDSDKTYQGMKWAYELVWAKVPIGGVVMSDDVLNDAFLEFSDANQQTPVVVAKPPDGGRVALIKRS